MEGLIEQYGYGLILVGSMIEGQPVMLFGGFAAHRGHLQLFPWVVLAGAVGNFLGLQGWYLAGRRVGRPLVERRPRWSRRIAQVQRWLGRYEALLVIAIRFPMGLGSVGGVAIGMSGLRPARFTLLNGIGAVLWAATLAVAGYLLGAALEVVLEDVDTVEKPVLIGLVVIALGWAAVHHLRAHRSAELPETREPSGAPR